MGVLFWGGENGFLTLCVCVYLFSEQDNYNFEKHVQWLVVNVDREDQSNKLKSVNREWVDIMSTWREVLMAQYENSPNANAFFQSLGRNGRVDPLQYVGSHGAASLDRICSFYESYRSMAMQINKKHGARDIKHITGYSDHMSSTPSMFSACLSRQDNWHKAFVEERTRYSTFSGLIALLHTKNVMHPR